MGRCLRTLCTIAYGSSCSSSDYKLFKVSAWLIPRKESANVRVRGIELIFCGVYGCIDETHGVEMYGRYTVKSNANTL